MLAQAGVAPRATASIRNFRAGREAVMGGGGEILGLAVMGVRGLAYWTCFVACCVFPSDVVERKIIRQGEYIER